jgi:hypothetical protein
MNMKLLFCHIPKNAGTSLAVHLSSQFPPGETFGIDNKRLFVEDLLADRYNIISNHSFVSGHISLELIRDAIPLFDAVVAIVRPPAERLASMFAYKRRTDERWSGTDLPTFLSEYYCENVATRNEQCSYIGRINTFESCLEVVENTPNLHIVHSYNMHKLSSVLSPYGLSVDGLPSLNRSNEVSSDAVFDTKVYRDAFDWFDGDFALSDYILKRSKPS